MRVIYMAHPYGGDPDNLLRAKRWMRWIEETQPIAVNASWILECEIWDDAKPEEREAGLQRDIANIRRCDEIWAVGGRISEGMKVEITAAAEYGIPLLDLTLAGDEPPDEVIKIPPLRWLAKKKGRRVRPARRKRCRRA
jgi:hypothetical protein